MATRDAVLHATARLAGDWDAPAFARTTLSGPGGKAILRELAARFASLDPLVREFLYFVLSKEGQEIVVKDGFYPLTAKVAGEELAKLK